MVTESLHAPIRIYGFYDWPTTLYKFLDYKHNAKIFRFLTFQMSACTVSIHLRCIKSFAPFKILDLHQVGTYSFLEP